MDLAAIPLRGDGPDYTKFDIKDELKARIVIPSGQVAVKHVHSLYREEATMVKNKWGKDVPEWDNSSYAGGYICLGDQETVGKAPQYGDPQACPMCAAMNSGPKIVSRPKKSFALNTVRYSTKPNTFEIGSLALEAGLWKHGDEKKISPLQTAITEGGKPVQEFDFLIESDGSAYKKWQISFLETPAYKKNADLGAAMQPFIDNPKYSIDDLTAALGDLLTKEQMENLLQTTAAQASATSIAPSDGLVVPSESPVSSSPLMEETSLAEIDAGSISGLL